MEILLIVLVVFFLFGVRIAHEGEHQENAA
jgi:hypothetical protein